MAPVTVHDSDDVMALIKATAQEPVPHLESRVTPRDVADIELLYAVGPTRRGPVRRSPRQALARARTAFAFALLVFLGVVIGVIVAATAAAADTSGPVTLSDDLDPLWRAMVALAVVAIVWEAIAWVREELARRRAGGGRR